MTRFRTLKHGLLVVMDKDVKYGVSRVKCRGHVLLTLVVFLRITSMNGCNFLLHTPLIES